MIKIIPAIDLIDGKCVRLTKGEFASKKIYADRPVEIAKMFEGVGICRLHLVDLDGAREGSVVNLEVLEEITSTTSLEVDFSGGIRTSSDVKMIFDAGAAQITCGSIAVKDRELFLSWLDQYGNKKIILGADVKNGKVAIHGWQEETSVLVNDFLEDYIKEGISYVLCTDISKDGALLGPAFSLYQELSEAFGKLKLIASGGVSSMDDLRKLNQAGLYGAVIGKSIYENRISLENLKEFLC